MIAIYLAILALGFVYSMFKDTESGILACGLAGFSGKKINQAALKLLFIDNEARGTHSSGVGYTNSGMTAGFYKTADKASDMCLDEFFTSTKFLISTEVILHTRYATMGKHSANNAHPYKFGDFVGTHNGWLLNEDQLIGSSYEEYSLERFIKNHESFSEPFDVDSMTIFAHMDHTKDVTSMKDIEGAMALAFLYEGNLHLYRRKSKPLFWLETDDGLYYSSRREGLELAFSNKADIKEVPINKVFVFNEGELINTIDVPEPKVDIDLDDGPTQFYFEAIYGGYSNYGNYQQSKINNRRNNSLNLDESFRKNNSDGVRATVHDNIKEKLYKGPYGISDTSMFNIFNHNYGLSKEVFSSLGYHIDKTEADSLVEKAESRTDKRVIALTVKGELSKQGLSGWVASVENSGIGYTTNSKGNVFIEIPDDVKGIVTIFLHPSKTGGYHYKKKKLYPSRIYELNINTTGKWQVLEVSCTVGFPSGTPEELLESGKLRALPKIQPKTIFISDGSWTDGMLHEDEEETPDEKKKEGGSSSLVNMTEAYASRSISEFHEMMEDLDEQNHVGYYPPDESIILKEAPKTESVIRDLSMLVETIRLSLVETSADDMIESMNEIAHFFNVNSQDLTIGRPLMLRCVDLYTRRVGITSGEPTLDDFLTTAWNLFSSFLGGVLDISDKYLLASQETMDDAWV